MPTDNNQNTVTTNNKPLPSIKEVIDSMEFYDLLTRLEDMGHRMDEIKTCHMYISENDELSFNTFNMKWPDRVHKSPWLNYGQIVTLIREEK